MAPRPFEGCGAAGELLLKGAPLLFESLLLPLLEVDDDDMEMKSGAELVGDGFALALSIMVTLLSSYQ